MNLRVRCMACSVALAVACLPGMVAAATVWVGPGDQPGRGTREAPYSFAQALAGGTQTDVRIEPGTTILLLDGTYRPASPNRFHDEKVRALFSRVFRIEVSGAPDQPVTIAPEPGATAYLDGTLELDAAHVRITGLEIGHADYDPTTSYPPAVAFMSSRNVELVNCNLFGSGSTPAGWSATTGSWAATTPSAWWAGKLMLEINSATIPNAFLVVPWGDGRR